MIGIEFICCGISFFLVGYCICLAIEHQSLNKWHRMAVKYECENESLTEQVAHMRVFLTHLSNDDIEIFQKDWCNWIVLKDIDKDNVEKIDLTDIWDEI